MGKQSGYLARMEAAKEEWMATAERITRQFDVDCLQIALHRYEKLNLGYQRIMEITELWEQVRLEYRIALSNHPEADVYRHHLDEEQRQITPEDVALIPFERRYPELREITYSKRKS